MSKLKFKKLICFALFAFITFGMASNTLADDNETVNIKDALLQKGYPQIVLDTMDNDAMQIVYEEDSDFAGAVLCYYNEEDGTFTEISVEEDGTYVDPRGQIPDADLYMNFTFAHSTSSGNKLSTLRVIFSYEWNNLPLNRWQDPISVSWDSTKFRLKDNTFEKLDKYDGLKADETGSIMIPVKNQVHSHSKNYASANSNGVTWYANLKGYTNEVVQKLYGYGTFTLTCTSSTASGSSTLYGHYVHPKLNINLGIIIKDYGDFSVSGAGTFDELGTQKTFKWPVK